MWIRSWKILVLVVLLLSSYVTLEPGPAAGIGEPQVTLEFDESEEQQTAIVAPGKNAFVVFPGTVRAYLAAGSQMQDIEIELLGSVEEGWPVTMNPAQLTMTHGDNESFTATVIVPEDANSDMPAVLEVVAIAKTFPGALYYRNEPINGTIFVTQYFGFSVDSQESHKEAETGDNAKFGLNVNNNGNGRDVFLAGIVDHNILDEDGLAVTLDRPEIEVGGKNTETVNLSVAISDDERSVGTHFIKVEVSSQNGRSDPVTYTFTLRVAKKQVPATVDPSGPDTPEEPDPSNDPQTPDIPDGSQDGPDGTSSENSDSELSGGSSMDTGLVVALVVIVIVIIGVGLVFISGRNRK